MCKVVNVSWMKQIIYYLLCEFVLYLSVTHYYIMNRFTIIILGALLVLASCERKEDPANADSVETIDSNKSSASKDCFPDFADFMGYPNIDFYTVQLEGTTGNNVYGYGNTVYANGYYDWRFKEGGCGITYVFYSMLYQNQYLKTVGVVTSTIKQFTVEQASPDYLLMDKDNWVQQALTSLGPGCVDLSVRVHVFDSKYALASFVMEEVKKAGAELLNKNLK